jgi:cell division protein FtsB
VGPVHGYLSQRQQLAEEQRNLSVLIAKRDALKRQIAALDRDDVLEARARELGMVKPGERSYLVREREPAPGDPGSGSDPAAP